MSNVWHLVDETSGASQPAFNICPYGAAQPVGRDVYEHVTQCVGIRVVSFNIGMPQSMLTSEKRWHQQHVFKVRDVLAKLGRAANNDIVLCSEVGDMRKGFQASTVDYHNIVLDALPGASYSTSGAYLNIWNVPTNTAAEVQSGTWTASTGHATDMH